jgi:Skp family chaperone for outer membrane proteins
MKKLFILVLFMSIYDNISCQCKIAIVDLDRLTKSHPLYYTQDSIYNSYKKSFSDSLEILYMEFNQKTNTGYPSSNNMSKHNKESKNVDIMVDLYNNFLKTKEKYDSTLNAIKTNQLESIIQQIKCEIRQYSLDFDFDLVLDRGSILFIKNGIDITEPILNKLNQ